MRRVYFTHQHYQSILEALQAERFPIVPVRDYVGSRDRGASRLIVLRHDVDRKPGQAIRMARLEAAIGVRASYYFRCPKDGAFNREPIEAIARLGHEVGYHYENLSQFAGDLEAAIRQFAINLARFREIQPCVTVCAHGKPLSSHNNFTQMLGHDLGQYGLIADASLSLAQDQLVYFTDTGGRWNIEPTFNYRDYVRRSQETDPRINPSDTAALVAFLRGYDGSVYISTHPERWAHSLPFLVRSRIRDIVINTIKLGLKVAGLR